MKPYRLRVSVFCSLTLVAACSSAIDAAPPSAEPAAAVVASRGDASEWRHLIPHTAPFGPARSRDGRLAGPVTMWHENGIKSAQGEYRDEKRQGLWQFWHPSGSLRWDGAFDHGIPVGLQRAWYENGHLQCECIWIDGELDGKFSAWHENGRRALRSEFTDGQENGEVWRWNEDAELDSVVSGIYRDGEKVAELPTSSLSASTKH